LLTAAQTGKTTFVFIFLAWAASELGGNAMLVLPDTTMAFEVIQSRFLPFIENIKFDDNETQAVFNKDLAILFFKSLTLHIRGSVSRAKLQSVPIRWLIMDEVANFRKGAFETVTKRIRSTYDNKIIIIGTPLEQNDALFENYKEGTQTIFVWNCPYCGHGQPFKFGSRKSLIYKNTESGGLKWDERLLPNGDFDYEFIKNSIYYECENCKCKIYENQKNALINSVRPLDLNPEARKFKHYSYHFWAAYIKWVSWFDIVSEYIRAREAEKAGNPELMKSFVRETLGEPFAFVSNKTRLDDIKSHIKDFKRGELINTQDCVRILTADVQKEAMLIKYVYRQWLKDGNSRLIDYGFLPSLEDLRRYQIMHNIKDKAVLVDSGYLAVKIYAACLSYGWIATKGDKVEGYSYVDPASKKFITIPYKISHIDPFLGTDNAGKRTMPLIRFSSNLYKDRLFLYIIKNKDIVWDLPSDIGDDYVEELSADEYVYADSKRKWIETATNDFADCEILQLLASDLLGLSKINLKSENKNIS